ncbi:MAG: hypothetical protein RL687_78 [Candidatus Parcubacteria bacterium]|jgi:hypothetical protein
MGFRSSNSQKTPNKKGVVGANKNDAHETKAEKQIAIQKRKEKSKKQKNLLAWKKKKKIKKKKSISNSELPEGLRVKGWLGD